MTSWWRLVTLPGFEAIPDPAPAKTASGYLTWLAAQTYPDGWAFWCLAGITGRAAPDSEWVVLVRDRQMREACIDLRTGAVRKWGERI